MNTFAYNFLSNDIFKQFAKKHVYPFLCDMHAKSMSECVLSATPCMLIVRCTSLSLLDTGSMSSVLEW